MTAVTTGKTGEEAEEQRAKHSPLLTRTPAEIEAYIDGFGNIEDAKPLLKELSRAVRIIARRI